MSRLQSFCSLGRVDEETCPFILIGKSFLPKKQIGVLFNQHIKRVKKDRFYVDTKRHHKTDGVILTPVEGGYRPQQNHIFKWKYADKLSIDFKMRFDQVSDFVMSSRRSRQTQRKEQWAFYASGGRGLDVEVRDVDLTPEDTNRVGQDMRRNKALDDGSFVVELVYDVWSGRWRYLGMRPDKTHGNNVRVAFDTLEVIAESVTQHELCYRLPRTVGTDNWQSRMIDAMAQMTRSTAHQSQLRRSGGQRAPPPPQQAQQAPPQ